LDSIAEKYYENLYNLSGFGVNYDSIDMKDFLTDREIAFQYTIADAPADTVRRFYFDYNKKRSMKRYVDELIYFRNKGQLKEDVDIEFTAYLISTILYNTFLYFKEKNISDSDEQDKIKRDMYQNLFMHGFLKNMKVVE
jgi:hypothetical protein